MPVELNHWLHNKKLRLLGNDLIETSGLAVEEEITKGSWR